MKRHSKAVPQSPPMPNAKKRPVHKANLHAGKVQMELDRKHPEPMSLFHKREKNHEVPAERLPKPQATLGQIDRAATSMAAWENSDPFSYDRTALHVRQGYLRSDEVIKEMSMRTLARRAARVKEVDDAKA